MNICLFTNEEIEKPLSLRDERAQHLIKVLHKKEGDTFSAGIIGGMAGNAEITSIITHSETASNGKEFTSGEINFTFTPLTDGKPLNPLVMIIGFPRPIQLKRLLRDMAALGVAEVHLTGTELSEKSYLKSDLATSDAGYQMLLDGTVQAASTHVPLLVRHETLSECLESLKNHEKWQNSLKTALDNVNISDSLNNFLYNRKNAHGTSEDFAFAAIGSERGWTENERDLLEQAGFSRLSMGPRVMRTETAATVAASIILNAFGKLN